MSAKKATEAGKTKSLAATLSHIEKQYGKGAIMKLGDDQRDKSIRSISTGALALDVALGTGGVPRGRVTEIFGPEASGKTTLALHIVAEAQKIGGTAAYIDAEHALDTAYSKLIGVDIDSLLVSQPDDGEQALNICEMLVRSNAVDIVVVDSVAALVPRAEIEGEMGDTHMGLQARLMSQALRKLTGAIHKSSCCVIFINQLREKIGVIFGNPETTPGGRALKFYASVRIDVRRIGTIKDGDTAIGSRVRAKVVKNKTAPPFRQAEFDIMYTEGISGVGSLLDMAVEHGVVTKSGAWYHYASESLGQGREGVKRLLREDTEIAERIKVETLAKLGMGPALAAEAEEAAEAAAATEAGEAAEAAAATDGSS